MSAELSIPTQLQSLFDVACDELATRAQLLELEDLVEGDEQTRSIYLAYCQLHVDLHFAIRGERSREAVREGIRTQVKEPSVSLAPTFFSTAYHGTIGYFSQELPFSLLIATVLTSLGLWFASMIYVSSPEKIAKGSLLPAKSSVDPTLNVVGKITGMVDCKWADPQTETFNGANVLFGRKYALASGLMEITYDTGAKVILQGPVTYEVETNGGYLAVGKLTGKLEKKLSAVSDQRSEKVTSGQSLVTSGQWSVASKLNPKSRNPEISQSPISNPQSLIPNPFCIRTPNAVVTDLGTEFGVEVSPQRESQVYVFKGKVKLEGRVADGLAARGQNPEVESASLMLEEGQGARLQVDGCAKRFATADVKPLAQTFVRQVPRVSSDAYAKVVLADKPLFYWTFDEPFGPAFEQVRHVGREAMISAGGATRCGHAAIGSGLALGRAADFTRAPGCFRLAIQEEGKALDVWAIEFWAQFAGDPNSRRGAQYLLNAGLTVDRNKPGILFNWPVSAEKNELQLYADENSRTRDGPIISDNHWHHLILAFYGKGRDMGVAPRVDMVLDGTRRTISRGNFSANLELRWGAMLVGAGTEDLGSPFHGRIDELAFYDLSKLTEREIEARVVDMARRHLQAAKLQSGNP